jgi:hypothetical protein
VAAAKQMRTPWQPVGGPSCHRQSDPFPLRRRTALLTTRVARRASRHERGAQLSHRERAFTGAVELHGVAVHPADGGRSPALRAGLPGHPLAHDWHSSAATGGAAGTPAQDARPARAEPRPAPTASGGRPPRYRTRRRRGPSMEPMAPRTGEPSEAPGVDDLVGKVSHLHVVVLAVLAEDGESLVLGDPNRHIRMPTAMPIRRLVVSATSRLAALVSAVRSRARRSARTADNAHHRARRAPRRAVARRRAPPGTSRPSRDPRRLLPDVPSEGVVVAPRHPGANPVATRSVLSIGMVRPCVLRRGRRHQV